MFTRAVIGGLRQQLAQAAQIIAEGGIVAYPTESCYGLGCDPRCEAALARLLRIKRRSYRLGLIVIAADEQRLRRYIHRDTAAEVLERARATWPGPHTWLLPADPRVSPRLRGDSDKIALRVTAHPLAAALCRYARRAIVSTSANRHGRRMARSAAAVDVALGAEVDFVLAGPIGRYAKPTQIKDATTEKLIRAA